MSNGSPQVTKGNWLSVAATIVVTGGGLLVIYGRTVARLEYIEKDHVSLLSRAQASEAQLTELRQAAFGFGYDMRAMRNTVDEIRAEQKAVAKALAELNRKTP